MTLQVGMVGSDGIVIAGDTKWSNEPVLINRSWAAGRYGFNSTKMKINDERGMVVSCARNMETSCHIANEIISGLRTENFAHPILPIEAIGAKILPASGERNNAQCLIAFSRPTPQIFLFQYATVNGKWGPLCQKMDTIAIAGDNLNAAIFWADRYYRRAPVKNLVALAAHVVIVSHQLNTGTVSGLEVVLCYAAGIRRLSDESTQQLERTATDWDRQFGELIISHSQEFTYAPNVVG